VTAPAFAFGKNWSRFVEAVSEPAIDRSAASISALVGDLRGKSFLDIGCGSGIHSLAAARLGAARVHSFDFDLDSVTAAGRLKAAWAPTSAWSIERGSALDEDYLKSLGRFDVVYSWGVLHHTGDLWTALDRATIPTADRLVISIYNDQGRASRRWGAIKRRYNESGRLGRASIEAYTFLAIWGRHALASAARLRPLQPFRTWREYSRTRGMSPWVDLRDWAGGYPFEVAKPEDVTGFYAARGFKLETLNFCGRGHGCNEFVFRRAH
jgi:SAM-dependent methyltransferase